jgi:hypothetical protein
MEVQRCLCTRALYYLHLQYRLFGCTSGSSDRMADDRRIGGGLSVDRGGLYRRVIGVVCGVLSGEIVENCIVVWGNCELYSRVGELCVGELWVGELWVWELCGGKGVEIVCVWVNCVGG